MESSNNNVVLKPVGVYAETPIINLPDILGGKYALLLLVIVDGGDLLVVKKGRSWVAPCAEPTREKYGHRKVLMHAVPEILPTQIITSPQDGLTDVQVLGSVGKMDGYGTVLVVLTNVMRSHVVLNAVAEHTWARSLRGLEKVLNAGEPDGFQSQVVRLGVQQAMKEGFLNWGQGATAH